jgi:putative endonuclease
MSPHDIGEFGEKIAARFLQRLGWKVLYRNFRAPKGGEVDLVMRDFGRPLRAVNSEKRALIMRGGTEWLRLLGRDPKEASLPDRRRTISWRYDVVEIILEEGKLPDINLVENAF